MEATGHAQRTRRPPPRWPRAHAPRRRDERAGAPDGCTSIPTERRDGWAAPLWRDGSGRPVAPRTGRWAGGLPELPGRRQGHQGDPRRDHPQWCDGPRRGIVSTMTSPSSRPSHLTRSTTDKKIGGVAGGLASYFGIAPLLVRISFAVAALFSAVGLVAYILMLAFVPTDDDAPAGARPAMA